MSELSADCESNHDQDKGSKIDVSNEFTTVRVMAETTAETPLTNNKPSRKHKRGGHHDRDELTLKHHLTNVAHCCTFTYTVLIVYLCFKQPFEFFTWHPLLLSLGWTFLMTEAVLIISKENVIPKQMKLNHTWKERTHWIVLTVGIVLIGIGFLVVTINKNRLNKEHYKSWHGIFGLMGIIAYIPPCLNGIPLLYRREIKTFLNPRIVKFVHLISGVLSLTCGGISLILSVYSKWFTRRTQGSQFIFYFCLVIVSFPVIWTMQRPLIKCIKSVIAPSEPKEKHKRTRSK